MMVTNQLLQFTNSEKSFFEDNLLDAEDWGMDSKPASQVPPFSNPKRAIVTIVSNQNQIYSFTPVQCILSFNQNEIYIGMFLFCHKMSTLVYGQRLRGITLNGGLIKRSRNHLLGFPGAQQINLRAFFSFLFSYTRQNSIMTAKQLRAYKLKDSVNKVATTSFPIAKSFFIYT